ncbi:hypothetical protein BGW38_002218 [Lunasporangiospora selenospora]|uniref:Uncharacterized protein n=1 Tax=Lunasporangiospora selenospora TaxID=979761 RepID=A0A9P6FUH8_9FUNG|nr:hypothetical protein BGW38_002218 [Lunasporangiospora selenospora]
MDRPPTSLSALERYTRVSSLAPVIESDEYVFILSCLQPHVDMARLCNLSHSQLQQNIPPTNFVALALSCMNQYDLRRACRDWKAIIVHIDPECIALQQAVVGYHERHHIWAIIQAIVWSSVLVAVGKGDRHIQDLARYRPTSRLGAVSTILLGCLVGTSCAAKTIDSIKAIPEGYDVVRVKNKENNLQHLFLIRRDFAIKTDPKILPMYILSGLGLGTILLGVRIAFKTRKA